MKVHILSAYSEPVPRFGPDWLLRHADISSHTLVDCPSEAELILFVESFASLDPFFLDVVFHPINRRYSSKCVLYHNSDVPHTLCRTISPSVESTQSNLQCRRTFHYIARRRDNSELPDVPDGNTRTTHLFSFVGAAETHPLRREILRLAHPNALLIDTSVEKSEFMSPVELRNFHDRFIGSVLTSKFVLCPRGFGPTSMRLFEVMQLGRVPVVIGDSWVPVPGIPWDTFAIFVPESQIHTIPSVLEAANAKAATMGAAARAVWELRFSPKRSLDELVEAARLLLKEPYGYPQLVQDTRHLLRPKHWKQLFGYMRRRFKPKSAL